MKFVAFEIDRIVSEDTNLSLFSNKSQFRQIKHSSHHVNLSIISSISFIHCTCLLIYLHRFSFFFFFYPFQSTNKEKSQRRTSIVSPIDVIIIRYSVSSMKKKKKKEIRSKRVCVYIYPIADRQTRRVHAVLDEASRGE